MLQRQQPNGASLSRADACRCSRGYSAPLRLCLPATGLGNCLAWDPMPWPRPAGVSCPCAAPYAATSTAPSRRQACWLCARVAARRGRRASLSSSELSSSQEEWWLEARACLLPRRNAWMAGGCVQRRGAIRMPPVNGRSELAVRIV